MPVCEEFGSRIHAACFTGLLSGHRGYTCKSTLRNMQYRTSIKRHCYHFHWVTEFSKSTDRFLV